MLFNETMPTSCSNRATRAGPPSPIVIEKLVPRSEEPERPGSSRSSVNFSSLSEERLMAAVRLAKRDLRRRRQESLRSAAAAARPPPEESAQDSSSGDSEQVGVSTVLTLSPFQFSKGGIVHQMTLVSFHPIINHGVNHSVEPCSCSQECSWCHN